MELQTCRTTPLSISQPLLRFVRRTLDESIRVTKVGRVDICQLSAGSVSNSPYDVDYEFGFDARLEEGNFPGELCIWIQQDENWGKGKASHVSLYCSDDRGQTWRQEKDTDRLSKAGTLLPNKILPYGFFYFQQRRRRFFPVSEHRHSRAHECVTRRNY
jgi:hypothetical protein